ncbi:MAG: hypothetical protein WKG03_00335 [Telluria sp.]
MIDSPDEFIVKIQRPLTTSEPIPVALVYNEERTLDIAIPMVMMRGIFPKHDPKVYFYATFSAGQLALDRPAPTQNW